MPVVSKLSRAFPAGLTAALCLLGTPSSANAETAHLKPDPSCVPVGVKLQLGLTGAKFKGAGVWTGNKDIATASESGVVKGVSPGETVIHIGGAAEKVSWGNTHLTVVKTWADCAKVYAAEKEPPLLTAPSPSSFKFTFMSDPQGDKGKIMNKKTVNYEFSTWFAKQMANTEKPAFILVGGDLANYGADSNLWVEDTVKSLKTSDGTSVVANYPIYSTIGNHDLVNNALGYYKEGMQNDWHDMWAGNYFTKGGPAWPTNGPMNYGEKGLAYSFVYGNSLFIVIDAYYLWGNAEFHKASSDHGELEEIDARQLAWVAWLSNWAKENATAKGLEHIFLLSHAPLLTTDRPNNTQLEEIIKANPMFDALLAGHKHKLDLQDPAQTGSIYELIDGTAAGDVSDHSYLRLAVNGKEVQVTPVHKTADGPVDGPVVTWRK